MEEEKKGFVVKDRRGGEQPEPQTKVSAATESGENTPSDSPANPTEMTADGTKSPDGTTRPATQADPGGTANIADEQTSPEISFVNFIISLGTTALFNLGMFPDPETKQAKQNLPAAKQVIDIIAMLQEKTKGNLDPEEAAIVQESLYNLRMSYIKATQAGAGK